MKKVYPESSSFKELFITAAFFAMLMTFSQSSQWMDTNSTFVRFIFDTFIPVSIMLCLVTYVRTMSYRRGYAKGRQHERNMQDICTNIKSAIDKKSANEEL